MGASSSADLSFTLDDGGLSARLSVAPQIVNYFAAKALGRSFAKHRKQVLKDAPGKLKNVARRSLWYTGFPTGGREHLLLRGTDAATFGRIHQKVFTTSPITAIHEFGGTILPKNAEAMLVPASKLRIGRGAKTSANRLADRGPTRDTFVVRGRRGTGFLFRRDGAATPELVGLFLASVTIQPRLGVFKAWDKLKQYRTDAVADAVSEIDKSLESGRPINAEAKRLIESAYKRERRAYERDRRSRTIIALGGT